ncbi:virulence plasmid A protein [Luteibacter sp. UNC138MFCol5.1]|nr:virulence plasmid A protein [Luteibacter sp. UNC138MFCol5.1]
MNSHEPSQSPYAARADLIRAVESLGYTSVFDIVRQPRETFVAIMRHDEADAIYDAAERRAAYVARVHNAMLRREEPAVRGIAKLGAGNGPERITPLGLSEGTDYDHWFARNGVYADDASIASLFSPGSYLVELYHVAHLLHGESHALNLARRRPDIPKLALTQENLDTEVRTLDLVNEVLLERTGGTSSLATGPFPFPLPYDHDAATLDKSMPVLAKPSWDFVRRLKTTVADWKLRFETDSTAQLDFDTRFPAELARSLLGLCPVTYARMITPDTAPGGPVWWAGKDPTTLSLSELLQITGLSLAELNDLIGTEGLYVWTHIDGRPESVTSRPRYHGSRFLNFAGANDMPSVAIKFGEDDTAAGLAYTTPARFERMQRMIRLHAATGGTFEALDYIATADRGEPTLAQGLKHLAHMKVLRDEYALDPWAYAGIVCAVPNIARRGHASQIEQRFGRNVAAHVGARSEIDFASALGDVDERSRAVRASLCAGLGVDDSMLVRLVSVYCTKNGVTDKTRVPASDALVSAAFRICEIARVSTFTLDDLFRLWSVMSPEHDIPGILSMDVNADHFAAVSLAAAIVLDATISLSRWARERALAPEVLMTMLSTSYRDTTTPLIDTFVASVKESTVAPSSLRGLDVSADEAIRGQLSRHVGTAFGLTATVSAAMLRWIDRVLPRLGEPLTTYSMVTFWNDIHGNKSAAHPTAMIAYCQVLARFSLACQFAGLTERDIALIVAPEGDVSPLTGGAPPVLDLDGIYWLGEYAAWRDSLGDSTPDALDWLHRAAMKPDLREGGLAAFHGWNETTMGEMAALLGLETPPPHTFPDIHQLWRWMTTALDRGLSPRDLHDLASLSRSDDVMAQETTACRARAAAFASAAAHATTGRGGRNEALDGAIAEALRTACVGYTIQHLGDQGGLPADIAKKIVTADDLYEYLLVDTKISAVLTTSRIAEAIASVQLYIHRCRDGLEPGVDATALANHAKADGFFARWDAYHRRYATWAGLQRLIRYPASYIEPSLRYQKTAQFEAFEEALSQGRLTGATADAAFRAFVADTCRMLDLTWLDGYQIDNFGRQAWFLARDNGATPRYYWRQASPVTEEQSHWSGWTPIDAPIRPMMRRPSIVYFAGKLRVAWIEWKETRLHAVLEGAIWTSASTSGPTQAEAHVPPPPHSSSSPHAAEEKGETAQAAYFMLASRNDDDTWAINAYPLEDSPLEKARLLNVRTLEHFWVTTYKFHDEEYLFVKVSDYDYDDFTLRDFQINERLVAIADEVIFNAESAPGYSARTLRRPCSASLHGKGASTSASIRIEADTGNIYSVYVTANKDLYALRLYDGDGTELVFRNLKSGFTYTKETRTRPTWWRAFEIDETAYLSGPVVTSLTAFGKDVLMGALAGEWAHLKTTYLDSSALATFATSRLLSRLNDDVSRLLDYETQTIDYEPVEHGTKMRLVGAVGLYLSEIFLHAPFLIASRFLDERRFDEAEVWLRYLFRPDGFHDSAGHLRKNPAGTPLYWGYRPLQHDTGWDTAPPDTDDPDVAARAEPVNYKLAIFLRWIRLLVERGDVAFREQTRDSLVEARRWYVQAAQMLGPRPLTHTLPANRWPDPTVAVAEKAINTSLDDLDRLLPDPVARDDAPRMDHVRLADGLFLAPMDSATLHWWDVVEQRLYNLRHGLSIDGLPMLLPLYETPVDPRELQMRRVAADSGSPLPGAGTQTTPSHRFPVLLDRARAAVQNLMPFGSGLQGALERRDGDALTVLQQTHHTSLFELTRTIHERNIESIERSLEALTVSKRASKERAAHFTRQIATYMLPEEITGMALRTAGGVAAVASGAGMVVAGALDAVPNTYIAGMAFGVGGSRWSGIAMGVANALAMAGQALESSATNMEMAATYRRRAIDWQREVAEAEASHASLEKQELAQRASLAAARAQLSLMDKEQGHAQAVLDLLGSRFSARALYDWQASRLSTLYYQLYDACLGLCAQAQQAYAFETGDKDIIIKPGAWDDRYQGLLAGEHLWLSLQRLEQAWLEHDARCMEIERTVSLQALAPDARLSELIALAKMNGSSGGENLELSYEDEILRIKAPLPGMKLVDDYPDNMGVGSERRIKSIAVTLPALLGPYEDVRAVLSYTGEYASTLPAGCSAVAVSRGLADSGQFVLDFNDGRYLPFEGIPVNGKGTFALSFPDTAQRPQTTLLDSITDIILHIRYTARQGAGA